MSSPSVDFYGSIPGAAIEARRPGEFAVCPVGDRWLGLLHRREPGFHLEFAVPDLDGAYAALRTNGIEVRGRPRRRSWGERTFTIVDPDGNHIEFQ